MAASPLGRRVLLKGVPGTEVFSNIRGPLAPGALDARALTVVAELPDVACVRESLAEWHRSLAPVCREGGPQFTEMLSWEHIHGCWQGMSQEEYACVQETFAPLNCRALYESAFAVAPRFRRGRVDTTFVRRVIHELWPELLDLPIDPDFSARASQRARRRMGRSFRRAAPRSYLRYLRAARSREERRRARHGGA